MSDVLKTTETERSKMDKVKDKVKDFGSKLQTKLRSLKTVKPTMNAGFVTVAAIGIVVKLVNSFADEKGWEKTLKFTDYTLGGLVVVGGLLAAWGMLNDMCKMVTAKKSKDKMFYIRIAVSALQFVMLLVTMKMMLFYPVPRLNNYDRNFAGMIGGVFASFLSQWGSANANLSLCWWSARQRMGKQAAPIPCRASGRQSALPCRRSIQRGSTGTMGVLTSQEGWKRDRGRRSTRGRE